MIALVEQFLGQYVTITESDRRLLASIAEIRTFDRKVKLVEYGEVDQYFNFITKGIVRKYVLRGKEELIKNIVAEGKVLSSFVSFITGEPSRYIVETLEPTTLVSFEKENMEKLYQACPKWEKMGRLMITEVLLDREMRLIDTIRLTPRERFLKFMKEQPDLLHRVPQKYLASYLNMKPETFSRLKHQVYKLTEAPE